MDNAWRTPQVLYDALDAEFHFQWDLACSSTNCLAGRGYFHDEGRDALEEDWPAEAAWMCPPWGQAHRWIRKAIDEWAWPRGGPIVGLLPFDQGILWPFARALPDVRVIVGPLLFRPPRGVTGEPKDLGPAMIVVWSPGSWSASLLGSLARWRAEPYVTLIDPQGGRLP